MKNIVGLFIMLIPLIMLFCYMVFDTNILIALKVFSIVFGIVGVIATCTIIGLYFIFGEEYEYIFYEHLPNKMCKIFRRCPMY